MRATILERVSCLWCSTLWCSIHVVSSPPSLVPRLSRSYLKIGLYLWWGRELRMRGRGSYFILPQKLLLLILFHSEITPLYQVASGVLQFCCIGEGKYSPTASFVWFRIKHNAPIHRDSRIASIVIRLVYLCSPMLVLVKAIYIFNILYKFVKIEGSCPSSWSSLPRLGILELLSPISDFQVSWLNQRSSLFKWIYLAFHFEQYLQVKIF